MKKQQQIYTSERGKFWLFILPSAYIYTHIYTHALLKSKQWISICKKTKYNFSTRERKILGKVLQSKRLRGKKNKKKSYKNNNNILLRASKLFDKVLQSKRLIGIKTEQKTATNNNNVNILHRASKASEEIFW